MDFLLLHDDSYLGCTPKASLHTWEGQLGDVLMRQHLDPWRILSYEDAIGEEEEALQLYPCSFLDKQQLGGEDCNIPNLACS